MLNERIPVTLYERPEPSEETAINALVHQPRPRRPRWAAASADFIEGLQGESTADPLALLANVFSEAADAELVCVAGGGEEAICESLLRGGLTLVVPMGGSGKSDRPALLITATRPGGASPFTAGDLESAADFARLAHAGLQLDRSSTDGARLAVLADRDRIASELHDRVIQRVFAAGLSVQALAGMTTDPMLRQRLSDEVGTLDAVIAELRTAIFALSVQAHAERPSVRRRILDLLEELGPLFPHPPRVLFSGAIDLQVSTPLADDLLAVVREGLTNVVRHAQARDTAVSVSARAGFLTIKISDNGVGLCGSERCSGIANLSVRAARWQGTVSLSDRESGGVLLLWTARLAEVPGGTAR
ncbi:MAG TPA: histidine kinase [Cryobacterium sp.]|nr:histidine kinase [Cryobacterium sp.]